MELWTCAIERDLWCSWGVGTKVHDCTILNNTINYQWSYALFSVTFSLTFPSADEGGTVMVISKYIILMCLLYHKFSFMQKCFLWSDFGAISICAGMALYSILIVLLLLHYYYKGFHCLDLLLLIVWNVMVLRYPWILVKVGNVQSGIWYLRPSSLYIVTKYCCIHQSEFHE